MTADDMRALRKRLGMTQAQLAEALGLKTSSISNYEGTRGPYKIPRVVELACERLETLALESEAKERYENTSVTCAKCGEDVTEDFKARRPCRNCGSTSFEAWEPA